MLNSANRLPQPECLTSNIVNILGKSPTMPASKDPKSYVKPLPLPIPACSGMKLLARDSINFNPEIPSREDVRKNNYNRRLNQMSTMGFRSASHKPYIGIGDPFYLDEKKMILHALGQWTEVELLIYV